MQGKKIIDYDELSDFLRTPKTAVELEKKYKCRRNVLYGIITHATFVIPLYEFKNEEGMLCYGLMEGVK